VIEQAHTLLRFIPLSLRSASGGYASLRGIVCFANVTLQALPCFCLFGRWPKILSTRAAGGR